MKTYQVQVTIDMIKISPMENGFQSVLWCPFDDDTPIARVLRDGKNVKEIEAIVSELAQHYEPLAKARIASTGNKFNAFRVWAYLVKGQRKPNGWNTSRGLKIEKQI